MNIPSSFYVKTWISGLFNYTVTGISWVFDRKNSYITNRAIIGFFIGFVNTVHYTNNEDGKFEFQFKVCKLLKYNV